MTSQTQEQVWLRQKGMCGLCGKKFELFSDTNEKLYIPLKVLSENEINNSDSYVLLCNHCMPGGEEKILKKFIYQYADFANYNNEEKFRDFTPIAEEALAFAQQSSDNKEIRNKLKDALQDLKSLNLGKELSSELNSKLNEALDEVNKKQREESEKLAAQNQEIFDATDAKVKETIDSVLKNENLRDSREALIALQQEINKIQGLRRDQKDDFYQLISKTYDEINKKADEEREKFEMECSENYFNLKSKVEDAIKFAQNSPIYKQAREALMKVQAEFKGLKLKKEHREELFGKIQTMFEDINKRQDEERSVFDSEAAVNYEKVVPIVNEAIGFAESATNFKQGREALINAQAAIKETKLKKEQRDELYGRIRTVFEALNNRQIEERGDYEKETSDNYEKLTTKVTEAFAEVDVVAEFNPFRDKLIAIQGEIKLLKLKKEQRNELFEKVRGVFAKLDIRRKEYRENRSQEKHKRLASILENLENKVARIEDSISWDIKSLNFQKDKLEKLNDDEVLELKPDIESKISMLNERIQEKEDKIKETKERINDIQSELQNLDNEEQN